MLGEFENKKYYKGLALPDYKRYRQFYISLDIDFSKIKTKSRVLKKVYKAISFVKIPLPTIEFSNKKVRGYFFYF